MRASVTRAAEGFDRRSFTVDEILRMPEAGIISEDENFERIEGEILPMQAKTHVQELIKSALTLANAPAISRGLRLGMESSIYLMSKTFVEPDPVVYPRGLKLESAKGSDIVLAIEVALTTPAYDRGLKSRPYARHGVQEFWVVDAAARKTYIHRAPSDETWTATAERGPEDEIVHPALPGFALRLAEV